MTLRQPHQDAVLPAHDADRMRQALVACSRLLARAEDHCGLEFTVVAGDAAEAAGLGRAPGVLAYQVSLAVDCLDFASAAGSAR